MITRFSHSGAVRHSCAVRVTLQSLSLNMIVSSSATWLYGLGFHERLMLLIKYLALIVTLVSVRSQVQKCFSSAARLHTSRIRDFSCLSANRRSRCKGTLAHVKPRWTKVLRRRGWTIAHPHPPKLQARKIHQQFRMADLAASRYWGSQATDRNHDPTSLLSDYAPTHGVAQPNSRCVVVRTHACV